MPRTNATLVQGVLVNDYDGVTDLTPYIDAASAIVGRVITCASQRGIPLSSSEAELVERWLAAHGYALMDQPYTARKTADASGNFQGRTGMYLEATKYGQMATNLDPSGCLYALSKRQVARVIWLGKPPSEQIDYVDRD